MFIGLGLASARTMPPRLKETLVDKQYLFSGIKDAVAGTMPSLGYVISIG